MNLKNKYESVLMINPELNYIGDIKDKITSIVDTDIIAIEDLGIKQLACNIGKINKGHYIRIEFYGDKYVKELERYFQINSDILKYITIETKDNHCCDIYEYNKQLYEILDIYTENSWEDEPLNRDEVDRLTELLRVKLYLINGNITQEEYDKIDKLGV